jgi:hypothetical protein
MAPRESFGYWDPLDVLCRFVPTPQRARYRIGSLQICVETNDFTLLPALPFYDQRNQPAELRFAWKLVRDHNVTGLLEEPVLLTAGELTVVRMGEACLLGIDHDRRELLGFIGAEVDSGTFQEFLLPFLCRLSHEALNGDSVSCAPSPEDELADA